MPSDAKLLLVGCGKMGGALLERAANLASSVHVIEPASPANTLSFPKAVTWLKSPDELRADFTPDIVLLAIKPQQMAMALPAYARFKNSVFLSIAAGLTLARLGSILSQGSHPTPYAIARAMPNLPASIGRGISVVIAGEFVNEKQHLLCETFLNAVGEVLWLSDEKHMDAVTALSGSGPAYVFALCEAMTKAGTVLGLTPEVASRLARQTVIGSGALLAKSLEPAEKLRKAVTSPGGTTEAALEILLASRGLSELVEEAMNAAAKRSRALTEAA